MKRLAALALFVAGASLGAAGAAAAAEPAGASAPKAKAAAASRAPARRPVATPPVPSVGQLNGLHAVEDELALKSAVALVVDRQTDEVLFSKNAGAVLPIASITKLMTAMVIVESGLSLSEPITVSNDDVRATAGGSRRGLAPGTVLTRAELLRLALMASENRAAHALGRTFPGGLRAIVEAMNARARLLGMGDTRYVEPTGLSSDNRSSARDLTRLVRAASEHPLIREYSTTSEAAVETGRRALQFRNTNGLVHRPDWDIEVQKTGYIAAAGRCLVMQARLAGRELIMVLLDSAGRYSRLGDAERLRRWLVAGSEAISSRDKAAGAAEEDDAEEGGADADPAPKARSGAAPASGRRPVAQR